MVSLQGYGAAAAGSSRSGAGKIFPAHYKECRLGSILEYVVVLLSVIQPTVFSRAVQVKDYYYLHSNQSTSHACHSNNQSVGLVFKPE